MRVVVTRIGPDGTMRRRMADTAVSGEVGPWEELIARALAAPPPNRPGTPGPVYHLRAGERGVLVAGHDLSGPLYELVTAVPSAGRHLEQVTSQPAGALAAGFSGYGEDRVVLAARSAVRRGSGYPRRPPVEPGRTG
jgi:hypothetical protein